MEHRTLHDGYDVSYWSDENTACDISEAKFEKISVRNAPYFTSMVFPAQSREATKLRSMLDAAFASGQFAARKEIRAALGMKEPW